MMSLTFGLFTQVSGSGPLGPLVFLLLLNALLKSRNYRMPFSGIRHQILSESFMRLD